MSRHWLTSTTALALVLNAAAPLSVLASQVMVQAGQHGTELRLAQNDIEAVADDLISDVISEAPNKSPDAEEEAAPDVSAETQAATEVEEEPAESEMQSAPEQAEEPAIEREEAGADTEVETEQKDETGAELAQPETDRPEAGAEVTQEPEDAPDAAQEADAEVDAGRDSAPASTDEVAPAPEEAGGDSITPTDEPKGESVNEPAEQSATSEAEPSDSAAASVPEADADDANGELPQISAEEQASAAEAGDASSGAAAAATEGGEVVDSQEATVTKEQSRASNEEFDTTASGKETPAASKKNDNDLLKAAGFAAAIGLGAYAVGQLLDNGGKVVSNSGDRAVIREPSGAYRILKDDDTLLHRPGAQIQIETYSDGSTRSTVTEADGSSTVTIRAADGRVLRRTRVLADGRHVQLFDDTRSFDRVDVREIGRADRNAAAHSYDYDGTSDSARLRAALNAVNSQLPARSYSLNQIRRIDAVRHLVPEISLDAINFRTGSAVIEPGEAQSLAALGNAMREAIYQDPAQVFLIEGHTDTVGAASYNLALSDRRAESVALALTEYFTVPPANMIVQGYGESDLRVRQAGDIRANRRAAVRNITPLLAGR